MNATKEYPTIYGSKWLPVVLYGFASLVDWQLTQLALATGGAHEANPLLASFGPLGMLAWKAFSLVAIVVFVRILDSLSTPEVESMLRKVTAVTLWLSAAGMTLVCAWNGYLLAFVLGG